jgi:glyoxylase-like metal-dependent hydrolase (beta-lactamase superfamily II)
MHLHAFTFNPFAENTYVLWGDSRQCAIIDPGCQSAHEQQALKGFITQNKLTPVRLLLTHCHVDHVFGNAFVNRTWGLLPEHHEGETKLLAALQQQSMMFGVHSEPSPVAVHYLVPGTDITFGDTTLQVLFTPGHSPASVCFYHQASKQCISGDVLFMGSIGRTDLPGGNYDRLMQSIHTQLLPLGDDVAVYPGHGPATTIGFERHNNPFLT